MADFGRTDVETALKKLNVKKGMNVFSHCNLPCFGIPEGGTTEENYKKTFIEPILNAVGTEGTYILPTYTYSFSHNEPFDIDHSPSKVGTLTEIFRRMPEAKRSEDPLFSVAAIGAKAATFTENASMECFGEDSFWDRFLQEDGYLLGLNYDVSTTGIHYLEHQLKVPYRYNKLFPGTFIKDGKSYPKTAIFYCTDITNDDVAADFQPLVDLATQINLFQSVPVGRGYIALCPLSDVYDLIRYTLKRHPYFLTCAFRNETTPVMKKPCMLSTPALPKEASAKEMIEAVWKLPRDLVSDGFDAALQALSGQIPMTIYEYPTGEDCWSWMVPEKWTCHEAYLETMDGRRIFSYADHLLHVASYSQPFEGIVSRKELFEHLVTDPDRPDAIPYTYLFYKRNWGLACSDRVKASLTDEQYRVVIRSEFCFGTLKVGEVVVPGKSEECLVLCAHLDHPEQANDGLSGVAVGIDVMRELMKRKDLHYTYRLVIVSETIGSAAYLSHNKHLIPQMKGGLFLEALGLTYPHVLQLSHQGDTEIDEICRIALQDNDPDGWVGKFERVVGNDEHQFNAPGVRVPMLSLSRVEKTKMEGFLYQEYHTHFDSMDIVNSDKLDESRDLILSMIDYFDTNRTPINCYDGYVFLTRFGVSLEFQQDPISTLTLLDIMFLLDGNHSIVQIAEKCDVSYLQTRRIIEDFHNRGIVRYSDD